ncbi:hypothetical protein AgCh_017497 [Apium graveolens]
MKKHEKRVWSVDFSLADPTMLASGSDDGSVKLWNISQAIVLFLLVSTWRSRGCIHVVVEVTASIIEIHQKDHFFRDDVSENLLHSEEMLAMLYSMSIILALSIIVFNM